MNQLNEHTRVAAYELTALIKRWESHNMDPRAIYSVLAMYHQYYGELGNEEMGESYMLALESEAHKLANIMLTRDRDEKKKWNIPTSEN